MEGPAVLVALWPFFMPLFTEVRGRVILRSSPKRYSRKWAPCLSASHEGKERSQIHDAGRYPPQ
jgi:hypothetical protein